MNHADHLRRSLGLSRRVICSAALCLLMGTAGCDVLKQLGFKTLLDPSQPIGDDPEGARASIRETIDIYDEVAFGLPKEAADPLPQDLQIIHEDYRLARGDTIMVQVWELQFANIETSIQRRVTDSGFVSLLRVPAPLYLADLTEHQAQQRIAQAYRDAGLLDDPQVSVTALTRTNRTFYVLGPFNQPGAFNIPNPEFRMLTALALVGDLVSRSAEYIYVIRTDEPAAAPPGEAPAVPGAPPGASPLDLPGGRAPTNGPDRARAPEPDGLEDWVPEGLGLPIPPTPEPPVPAPTDLGQGLPRMPRALDGSDGYVPELRDGKWTWVPRSPDTAPNGVPEELAGPSSRVIRIALTPLRQGDPRYNIVIRNRDVLIAPQPVIGEYYLMGNINRPGVYSLTDRRITLTQAIASGGGFGPLAVPSRVQLTRRIGADGAETRTILVDAGKIIEGKADDLLLKPYDVVNVGTAVYAPFLAVIRNAFRATYGVGFVYDRNFADIDSYGPRPNPRR